MIAMLCERRDELRTRIGGNRVAMKARGTQVCFSNATLFLFYDNRARVWIEFGRDRERVI